MKAFRVIYKHGHFIDTESGQRIIPVQGVEYTISSEDSSFQLTDRILASDSPLDDQSKKEWVNSKYKNQQIHKVLSKGEHLTFGFGNAKRALGDEGINYKFECVLLEDLYMYCLQNRSGQVESDWKLADCKCQLTACIEGGFTLSDKIVADSLNKLFANTIGFYFNMQRSTSGNAFKDFYIKNSKYGKLKISDIRLELIHNIYKSTDTFR